MKLYHANKRNIISSTALRAAAAATLPTKSSYPGNGQPQPQLPKFYNGAGVDEIIQNLVVIKIFLTLMSGLSPPRSPGPSSSSAPHK